MRLAAERIQRLQTVAKEAAQSGDYDRSRHYVRLAKRISQRERESLPSTFAYFTCDDCDVYMIPGDNATVRVENGTVTISCDCGTIQRYGYA